ncbi:DinB family protein [Neobacillus drentensis]|uniref:DinB family protein n=1 Tax=Neobacillus drentensis TaxID=220684 RepID=UPI00285DF551|nr:DinB family protein [Neobacillus drentensis]MDR7239180.1 putative damage-inducible protein DinB [Neobacillus drentensis]
MINHVENLYKYHVWANQRIIDHLKTLSPEKYQKEIKSVFSSVSKAFSHIYLVDYLWLNILEGQSMNEALQSSFQLQEKIEKLSIEDLETKFHTLTTQFKSFLNRQEDIEKKMLLDNPYAGLRETSLSEILLHVVNHGTYHRGNISAMLHQLGDSSVMTDYAFYWYSDNVMHHK